MATTEEMKPETTKIEAKQSPQVQHLLPPQQPPLPLPYKSCSLRVFFHCQGCQRKVKKILTSIEGVYRVEIDVKQNKVTVIGIIPPDILLKKLLKAGKQAHLLPEPVDDPKENNKKKTDTSSGNGSPVDGGETCGQEEEKKKDSVSAPSLITEKKTEEPSGIVGKKKKKKGQKTVVTPPPVADHDRPSSNQNSDHQILTNNNPPQVMYPYPPVYYAPQVMYGVSYNVAQPPVCVDTASYYTPMPPNVYAYMYPSDLNPYRSRPSGSFELFSDENPTGCSVM